MKTAKIGEGGKTEEGPRGAAVEARRHRGAGDTGLWTLDLGLGTGLALPHVTKRNTDPPVTFIPAVQTSFSDGTPVALQGVEFRFS